MQIGNGAIAQQQIQVGSVPISYRVAGQGAPVLLIHGLSGSGRWWSHNIDTLAQQFQVYVIDLVGFGDSRGTHPFVLNEASTYLVKWMDLLGIERMHVVGHSMGGFIAADMAADFPARVDRLVLVDAAALPFDHTYLLRLYEWSQAIRYTPFNFLPVLLIDAARAGPFTLSKAAYELLTTDIRPKLTNIQAETLIVWGEHDTIVPLDLGRKLCDYLPHFAGMEIIAGSGHNPMWDRPDEFNRIVGDFLRQI